jgi:23S rRNA (cytidine1920-2'-O)/16S rRNA (cytidine1409-2'-O)-methyltransferase
VTDPRVRLLENANARHMTPDWFEGDRIALAAVDVSFISLRLILPALAGTLAPGACVVALVKPQFEAAPDEVGAGGVVRVRSVHRQVLEELACFADQGGWRPLGLCASPLTGPAGNLEFFLLIDRAAAPSSRSACADLAIERVLNAAYTGLKSPGGAPIISTEPHDSTPGDVPT